MGGLVVNIIPNAISFAVTAAALAAGSTFLPERSFIQIRELTYSDGIVTFDRAISGGKTRAVWTAQVFNSDGDLECSGGGVSDYEPTENRRKLFPLDVWVGDPGCFDRLSPGGHKSLVTWIPLSEKKTVSADFAFEK